MLEDMCAYAQVRHVSLAKMVNFSAVVGCENRSNREKEKGFYRLPNVITGQGKETEELSEKRWRIWLASI